MIRFGVQILNMALLFLGSSPDRGQSPVEWGQILYIITSICTSVPRGSLAGPRAPLAGPQTPLAAIRPLWQALRSLWQALNPQ